MTSRKAPQGGRHHSSAREPAFAVRQAKVSLRRKNKRTRRLRQAVIGWNWTEICASKLSKSSHSC